MLLTPTSVASRRIAFCTSKPFASKLEPSAGAERVPPEGSTTEPAEKETVSTDTLPPRAVMDMSPVVLLMVEGPSSKIEPPTERDSNAPVERTVAPMGEPSIELPVTVALWISKPFALRWEERPLERDSISVFKVVNLAEEGAVAPMGTELMEPAEMAAPVSVAAEASTDPTKELARRLVKAPVKGVVAPTDAASMVPAVSVLPCSCSLEPLTNPTMEAVESSRRFERVPSLSETPDPSTSSKAVSPLIADPWITMSSICTPAPPVVRMIKGGGDGGGATRPRPFPGMGIGLCTSSPAHAVMVTEPEDVTVPSSEATWSPFTLTEVPAALESTCRSPASAATCAASSPSPPSNSSFEPICTVSKP
mmetsp:Transcript_32104/g.80018  ORF Transcript_32104/g.80018 Transcript_32104/m.80018 type:complete len:365 (+) Transcript_32104:3433-4527(+)